jgi:hypothetical protein
MAEIVQSVLDWSLAQACGVPRLGWPRLALPTGGGLEAVLAGRMNPVTARPINTMPSKKSPNRLPLREARGGVTAITQLTMVFILWSSPGI